MKNIGFIRRSCARLPCAEPKRGAFARGIEPLAKALAPGFAAGPLPVCRFRWGRLTLRGEYLAKVRSGVFLAGIAAYSGRAGCPRVLAKVARCV